MKMNKHVAFDNLSIIETVSESMKNETLSDLGPDVFEKFHQAVSDLQEILTYLIKNSSTQTLEAKEIGELREWLDILKWDMSDQEYSQSASFLNEISSNPAKQGMNYIFLKQVRLFIDNKLHRDITAFFATVLGKKETTLTDAVDWLITSNQVTDRKIS